MSAAPGGTTHHQAWRIDPDKRLVQHQSPAQVIGVPSPMKLRLDSVRMAQAAPKMR